MHGSAAQSEEYRVLRLVVPSEHPRGDTHVPHRPRSGQEERIAEVWLPRAELCVYHALGGGVPGPEARGHESDHVASRERGECVCGQSWKIPRYEYGPHAACGITGSDEERERGSEVGAQTLFPSGIALCFASIIVNAACFSLIFHFTHGAGRPSPSSTKEMHISTAEEILNRKSGWKALTGTTDFGAIAASAAPECKLAFDIFVDRVLGFVGSYYVKLEGRVDALVFAGGIGEKGPSLRSAIVEKCRCLGFEIDEARNGRKMEGVVVDIGREGKGRVLVCKTDEQFEMARECALEEV